MNMKNFFLSIFLLFMTTACSDETIMTTSAIIFTRPECTNTDKVVRFFDKLKEKHNSITYQIKDLSLAENRILIKKFASKHHLNTKQLYTPIVFTPKGFSSGWGERTKTDLKLLLNIR